MTRVKSFAIITYRGYPDGWGIPKENPAAMISPLSPAVMVGWRVARNIAQNRKDMNNFILSTVVAVNSASPSEYLGKLEHHLLGIIVVELIF
jgi:hypothetical protein